MIRTSIAVEVDARAVDMGRGGRGKKYD